MSDEFILSELARIRREKQLTRKALAKLVGVEERTLEKWELGESAPNFRWLVKWAARLGYELDLIVSERRK